MSHEPTEDAVAGAAVAGAAVAGAAAANELDATRVVLPGASSPVPVEDADHVELRRQALVDAISRAIAEVPAERRRRRLWNMSGRFALAAAVLLAVGTASTFLAVRLSSGGGGDRSASSAAQGEVAHVERFDTSASHSASSATVGEASTLVTSSSERLVATLPGHTVVEVAPRSRLILARLPASSQELILDRGVVSVDVPEAQAALHDTTLHDATSPSSPAPGAGEPGTTSKRRVRVTTPHAVVEVKGTQFDVIVGDAPSGGEITTVKVKRGRVLVTEGARRTFVGAGETWTSAPLYGDSSSRRGSGTAGPDDRAALNSSAGTEEHTNQVRATRGSAPEARSASDLGPQQSSAPQKAPAPNTPSQATPTNDNASTLAEQNRLLEAAVAAERQGNSREASRLLESLLTRFPDSPHRASALSRLRDLEQPKP